MTKTDTAASMAKVSGVAAGLTQGRSASARTRRSTRNGGLRIHAAKVTPAKTNTIGTKTRVTLSAKAWIGTLYLASSTS